MSEIVNDKKVFSLLEVAQSIQRVLANRYKSSFWVKAEMIRLNHYKQSGHCYPDLVEKKDGAVVAQMRANLWKEDYLRTNQKFIEILKEPLKDGIKLLFLAKITFEPSHGLALRILDIDPGYTLGDLEKEKQETIERLKREGIYNNNKLLKLPLLPQRIAIISVETSKGYADFLNVIDGNPWNYKFFHFLFSSILQGDSAVRGIITQLKRIKKVIAHFDLVAIIRGGGGDIGLSCYNDYQLTKEIALFPIPVITGIGHATNETVAEMVSHTNAITPTKLAEYLIQKFHNFSVPIQKAEETIRDKSKRLINDEKSKFQSEIKLFRSVTKNIFLRNRNDLTTMTNSLVRQSKLIFKIERDVLLEVNNNLQRGSLLVFNNERQRINHQANKIVRGSKFSLQVNTFQLDQTKLKLSERSFSLIKEYRNIIESTERNINNMSPDKVLRRGYSITLLNGKAVNSVEQVNKGDEIETMVADGKIKSVVK